VQRWEARASELEADPAPALEELADAIAAGDREALIVVGGQSAGLIRHVQPAGEIVRELTAEAKAALTAGAAFQL
jgi:NAD(P)H-dependent flavin oxidoreductase YrpB (nitropropane dioxygenase family)